MKRAVKILFGLCFSCILFACESGPLVYDATIQGKEILTPEPEDSPQINGASIFGVRPGSPVFYRVAVSGEKPLTYSAEGLPKGVEIDSKTGWIRGKAPEESGDYEITLHAENSKGESSKKFTIRVGGTISLTPPMGWNSWYVHSEGVSEEAIRDMAMAMDEKGLDQFGWTYLYLLMDCNKTQLYNSSCAY